MRQIKQDDIVRLRGRIRKDWGGILHLDGEVDGPTIELIRDLLEVVQDRTEILHGLQDERGAVWPHLQKALLESTRMREWLEQAWKDEKHQNRCSYWTLSNDEPSRGSTCNCGLREILEKKA